MTRGVGGRGTNVHYVVTIVLTSVMCVLIGCVHWNFAATRTGTGTRRIVGAASAGLGGGKAIKVMYDPILSFILLRTGTS